MQTILVKSSENVCLGGFGNAKPSHLNRSPTKHKLQKAAIPWKYFHFPLAPTDCIIQPCSEEFKPFSVLFRWWRFAFICPKISPLIQLRIPSNLQPPTLTQVFFFLPIFFISDLSSYKSFHTLMRDEFEFSQLMQKFVREDYLPPAVGTGATVLPHSCAQNASGLWQHKIFHAIWFVLICLFYRRVWFLLAVRF